MATRRIRRFLEEGPEEKELRQGDARLGQIAVSGGYLTDAQLDECLHEQAASAEPPPLGEILIRRKHLTSEQLLRILIAQKAPAPEPVPEPPRTETPSSDVIRPPTDPGHRWWDAVRIKLPRPKK